MTRRLIIERTEIRSETLRTRFDLLVDDPPSDCRTAVRPVAPRAISVPGVDWSAILGEAEHSR